MRYALFIAYSTDDEYFEDKRIKLRQLNKKEYNSFLDSLEEDDELLAEYDIQDEGDDNLPEIEDLGEEEGSIDEEENDPNVESKYFAQAPS